jgi:hypothetical protein
MKKNIHYLLVYSFLLLLSASPLLSQETDTTNTGDEIFTEKKLFSLSGSYKNLFLYNKTDNYYGDNFFTTEKRLLKADLNRLRLSPELNFNETVIIHVDFDNELIWSNYSKSYEFENYWFIEEYNQFADLSREPHYDDTWYYRTKIHRAYAKITLANFRFALGRQQIRFGSGRLWNPLDILNPLSPTFAEGAEEQKGTDAMKLDYYPGEFTEISLVFDPKRYNNRIEDLEFRNSNSIARIKATVSETDIALLGGYISRRKTGGMDLSTTLLDGILRGSLLASKPEGSSTYLTGNGGYEYTFGVGLNLLFEYFYNEKGLNRDPDLLFEYQQSLITGINQYNYFILSNRIITFNRHYLGLSLGYDFHPLVRGELFSIYDIEGRGLFGSFSLNINLLQNLDLSLGVMTAAIFKGSDYSSDFEEFEEYPLYTGSLVFYF